MISVLSDWFFPRTAHPKFEYKRMALGSSGDGEFISKYEKETEGSDKTKRSVKESDETRSGNKMLLPVAQKIAKRSAGILTKAQKRDKTAATTGAVRGPQDLEV